MMEHVKDVDLVLTSDRRPATGAVDADIVLHTAEELSLREVDVVADVSIPVANAAGGGALKPRPGVVEDFRTIVNQRRTVARVAHHVGGLEHEVAAGIEHD